MRPREPHRFNPRRGVSPIVATILLVAMTIVLAAVLYVLVSGLSKSTSSKTPLSTAFALGTPVAANHSGGNWYNFSVQAAGHGLRWGDLQFQLLASNGASVVLPGAATITVLNLTGGLVGAYAYGTASWVVGATLTITSQQTLSIYSAGVALHGDRLTIFGAGTFQGSVGLTIP
jgi:flagellin-like protein